MKNKLSVIVPVYYNKESLKELYDRIAKRPVFQSQADMELVFVDDGSQDGSFDVIHEIASRDERVTALKLSRNFGSFVACLAGLVHCTGDCAVIISADLQDPPELIDGMFEKWVKGNKVVMAVREKRKEGFIKVFFSRVYYAFFRALVSKDMPKGGFDFVLIDRQVIDVLTSIQEKNTTLMGLILWMGYKRAEIPYTRVERKYGRSRWSLMKKINYFLDSMMAFSMFPLRVFSIFGLLLSVGSFLGIAYIILAFFMKWMTVAGWPSLMALNLFMFGCLFLALGVIGEYVWRSLEESRKRPAYIVESVFRKSGIEIKATEAYFEKK